MGRGNKKIVRVVFDGTRCECSECNFMGNFTQVRLHLKTVHKFKGNVDKQRTSENCHFCGLAFPTKKEVQKHILNLH